MMKRLWYILFLLTANQLPAQETFHPEELVNPLMGTDSRVGFSNGNTIPAIALPWGMNCWTPQTGPNGNGWVGMGLADGLEIVGRKSKFWKPLEKGLVHFVSAVAPFQDKSSGHWYQFVTLPALQGNFLESSCTAMFSYAITKGMQLKILDMKKYMPMVEASYAELQKMSMRQDANSLVPTRVSGGTCVGDQQYYLGRKLGEGTGFGYGSFIMFGLAYEQLTGKRK